MEADWLQRWTDNRIGFHQQKTNSRLTKFWNTLELSAGAKIFVPLCGKSLDMIWLKESGYSVIGNELSDIACRDFFIENDLDYKESPFGKFNRFSGERITLLQGDFFDITPEILQSGEPEPIAAVFDRASLIALPAELRIKYARHLSNLLQPGSKIFLISMEYDQSKMKGPPFSVSEDEVREIFSPSFNIEILSSSSGPDIVGNLKERGLDTLDEKVYLIERLN